MQVSVLAAAAVAAAWMLPASAAFIPGPGRRFLWTSKVRRTLITTGPAASAASRKNFLLEVSLAAPTPRARFRLSLFKKLQEEEEENGSSSRRESGPRRLMLRTFSDFCQAMNELKERYSENQRSTTSRKESLFKKSQEEEEESGSSSTRESGPRRVLRTFSDFCQAMNELKERYSENQRSTAKRKEKLERFANELKERFSTNQSSSTSREETMERFANELKERYSENQRSTAKRKEKLERFTNELKERFSKNQSSSTSREETMERFANELKERFSKNQRSSTTSREERMERFANELKERFSKHQRSSTSREETMERFAEVEVLTEEEMRMLELGQIPAASRQSVRWGEEGYEQYADVFDDTPRQQSQQQQWWQNGNAWKGRDGPSKGIHNPNKKRAAAGTDEPILNKEHATVTDEAFGKEEFWKEEDISWKPDWYG